MADQPVKHPQDFTEALQAGPRSADDHAQIRGSVIEEFKHHFGVGRRNIKRSSGKLIQLALQQNVGILIARVQALRMLGKHSEAMARVGEALYLAERMEHGLLTARCHFWQGVLWIDHDKESRAAQSFLQAIQIVDEDCPESELLMKYLSKYLGHIKEIVASSVDNEEDGKELLWNITNLVTGKKAGGRASMVSAATSATVRNASEVWRRQISSRPHSYQVTNRPDSDSSSRSSLFQSLMNELKTDIQPTSDNTEQSMNSILMQNQRQTSTDPRALDSPDSDDFEGVDAFIKRTNAEALDVVDRTVKLARIFNLRRASQRRLHKPFVRFDMRSREQRAQPATSSEYASQFAWDENLEAPKRLPGEVTMSDTLSPKTLEERLELRTGRDTSIHPGASRVDESAVDRNLEGDEVTEFGFLSGRRGSEPKVHSPLRQLSWPGEEDEEEKR